MLDDARNSGERLRETRRIRNAPEMGVDDPVAAIGDKNVTVAGRFSPTNWPETPQSAKAFSIAPPRGAEAERNDLDRQRKAAERLDPFASRRRSRSCGRRPPPRSFRAASAPPPPLISVERGSISSAPSTVRSSRSTSSSVVRRMPQRMRVVARGLRRRHADHVQPVAHPRAQQLDEMLGGRAGAEAELHPALDVIERARRRLAFQFVQIHGSTIPVGCMPIGPDISRAFWGQAAV